MYELSLLIANVEGALVRVLGTIERRGFPLGGMSTEMTAQGIRITLSLNSEARPADVLLRQVRRVVDVRDAQLKIVRPAFSLPERPLSVPDMPAPNRRGMSFLGIPERVSSNRQVTYA